VLGADHPRTLASRNNLAGTFASAGRLEQAIPLYEQTLADCERVLGADHPDTLASRNNLDGRGLRPIPTDELPHKGAGKLPWCRRPVQ
jgi:hypothetical protein